MPDNDWPPVWLLFATYKRTDACLETISRIKKFLIYPNLHIHICDDGSGPTDDGTNRWHVGVLVDAISEIDPDVTWHEMDTPPGKFNTGGNINKGIQIARDHGCLIHMLNFDDWGLFRPLDLRYPVDILDTFEQVGFIRLSYLVPGDAGIICNYAGKHTGEPYMWLRHIRDWQRSNPWQRNEYTVSTQPYVAHWRFFETYGLHPEHCNPGQAEVGLGYQYNVHPIGERGPQILTMIGESITHAPWEHLVGRANDYLNA